MHQNAFSEMLTINISLALKHDHVVFKVVASAQLWLHTAIMCYKDSCYCYPG